MNTKTAIASEDELRHGGSSAESMDSSEYDRFCLLRESFTEEKQAALIRKIDFRILPPLVLVYLLAYIDRSNAGNAKLFGALEDLGLSGQQWNVSLAVFFITYAAGGVPSNITLKRVGPRFWLPSLLIGCGSTIICSGVQSTYAGWISFRLILGIIEAGYRGWRLIYVLEGLFSVVVGVACFWLINPVPAKVTGWLTDKEREYLVLRNRFAVGGESGIKEREDFNMADVKKAFRSIHTYSVALTEFTVAVVVYRISFVLPSIVQSLGYSSVKAQAMTAPPYIFACVVTIISDLAADRYRQRALSIILPNTMAVVGFVIITITIRYHQIPGVTYFGLFLMAGGLYPISPAVMAWVALNMAGSMKRAAGLGLMMSLAQLGGIVGSNIFMPDEAPVYSTGFGICIAMLTAFGVIWPGIYYLILKRINSRRAAIPVEEVMTKYTPEQLTDMGDESPLFRYAL
ncbi:uncharacterized protein NECHADRAFT_88674 [Fusarium vanettenii 77-13-4]|uniref:Major facilitator superfamily (MFS) profile domain-containing protein n=1 Tax=Fusarium vanettenii (strain ATCC MYA-4622 / CBS 123669 / FGSC 9596 / NRRL 45880 / 77-13-4) TaxID=660122 RepID=C7ZLH0_FUSV7|nr:uncharacterized protein NECHADRAFT_88674 [Fusarium vanettenii 77-13-4]EEU35135.1 hypothetical protein NECHADRAFT_88674 [Fusarium vanettenii 77-13-4]